jgi:hypothetical protein
MADVVNGLWIGESLGPIQRLSITSFLHHGHGYNLYTYQTVKNVPAGVTLKDGNEVLPASAIFYGKGGVSAGNVAGFSDLFRYKLLLENGGWWVDTDLICLKEFDFPEPMILASEETKEGGMQVVGGTLKAPTGHPVIQRCYEIAAARDPRTINWGDIGPRLLAQVVADFGMGGFVQNPEVFCPIPWWKWHLVLERDSSLCRPFIGAETYGIHLWNEFWRRFGLTQATSFPPGCFFSELHRQFGLPAPVSAENQGDR